MGARGGQQSERYMNPTRIKLRPCSNTMVHLHLHLHICKPYICTPVHLYSGQYNRF